MTEKLKDTEQEIAVIKDRIKENTASRHHLNVDNLREAVAEGELVLDRINKVIDRIYVYDKNTVEIIWSFEEGDGKIVHTGTCLKLRLRIMLSERS